ncbi:hypothetical protein ABVT39_006055 [Epinephelus coioides]
MDDESLPQKIGKALPELDFAQLNTLLKYLREELGVVTESDLQYVERDDIQPLLTPIQTRRLLKTCRGMESNGHMNTDSTGSSLELVTVTSSLLSSQSSTSPVLSASSPLDIQPQAGPSSWITRFVVPWEKMSPALSLAISMGKRADPRDRIAMVRTVVEAMQVHCPNPNRAACAEIAKAIVSKHPRTFGDITEEGELLGSGYHSLLEQLKRRVEHVNRNCDSHRIRQPKRTPNDDSNANRRVRSKVDSYGCINWQPKDLPEGETSDSLESKRVTLVELFGSMGPRAAELTEVDEFMRLTYIYQRYMINSCPPPPLHLLEEHWPFLFTKRGLCTHFLTLTGIDIDDRLGEALVTKGRRIVSFFQSQKLKWGNEIQALLKEMESATSERNQDLTAIAAVLLAIKYFHETEDSIFILADATATKISIEAEKDLPATPRLIMLATKKRSTLSKAKSCEIAHYRPPPTPAGRTEGGSGLIARQKLSPDVSEQIVDESDRPQLLSGPVDTSVMEDKINFNSSNPGANNTHFSSFNVITISLLHIFDCKVFCFQLTSQSPLDDPTEEEYDDIQMEGIDNQRRNNHYERTEVECTTKFTFH